MYFSIIILTIIFTLNDAFVQAFLFGPIALITTLAVDYKVQHLFVEPSSTLALSIARQLDDLDQVSQSLTLGESNACILRKFIVLRRLLRGLKSFEN